MTTTKSSMEMKMLIFTVRKKNEEQAYQDGKIERELTDWKALGWWMENLGNVTLRARSCRQDMRWDSISGEIEKK